MTQTEFDADVIVVGAGPGGSATAYHLAKHGARVLLLEKTEFPREKVCGDGLTPRAVKQPEAETTFTAPLVVAADGVSGRFPLALGMEKRDDRPMGVAVRRYYRCAAKANDDYLESWLELRSKDAGDTLLPGYGWIFG